MAPLPEAAAQRWSALLWEPSLPEGRSVCEAELREDALVAHLPEGGEVALALDTLVCERQGFDGASWGLRPEGAQVPLLITRAPGLLAALKAHPVGRRAVEAERARSRRKGLSHVGVPLGAVLLLLAGLVWFAVAVLPGLALKATPTSVDAEVGRLALPVTLAQLGGHEVKEPRVVQPVRTLLAPLTAGAQADPALRFEVHVVQLAQPNAFALPGGQLVVTTGLLQDAPSAEAVAGVLAHEVAHVTERHSMRALLRQAGVGLLLSLLVGDAAGAGGVLVDQAAALTGLSHSREMEREADRVGLELLRRAQLDPGALADFLRVMQQQEETQGAQVPAFLSSHPLTSDRLERLEALAAEKAAPTRPLDVDFKALQEAVRALPKR